jgi:hypothetical protein
MKLIKAVSALTQVALLALSCAPTGDCEEVWMPTRTVTLYSNPRSASEENIKGEVKAVTELESPPRVSATRRVGSKVWRKYHFTPVKGKPKSGWVPREVKVTKECR